MVNFLMICLVYAYASSAFVGRKLYSNDDDMIHTHDGLCFCNIVYYYNVTTKSCMFDVYFTAYTQQQIPC